MLIIFCVDIFLMDTGSWGEKYESFCLIIFIFFAPIAFGLHDSYKPWFAN